MIKRYLGQFKAGGKQHVFMAVGADANPICGCPDSASNSKRTNELEEIDVETIGLDGICQRGQRTILRLKLRKAKAA